ncbi:hypothetical protein RhiirA1_476967 [Rhizophagus irregularis]|uniref:Crinkler effector protein N-terminal domain-containing protein n=1 Tax=Rhizophagus irregularis TaxID=588596 RepID=A0A2N0QU64_9GLOM|nr:hypothetical protein RhiirA1_476967 [Rhizophagus irregularis]
MADITLYCYFLGTPINSAIPVDIGEMTCVEGVDVPIEKFSFGHLKKQILPNNNEANKLKLWKFETPFKKDNEKLKLLNENFHNDTDLEQELGEDLSPGELIRMIFPVGYIFSPNHIHIIVQPPSSPTITGPDEKKILNFIKQLSDIDTSQNVFIVPKLPGIEKDTIIYNRKCYSYLRDFILKDKRYKRYCIIRNPGIGKTYFRWLMLVELLKQNKSIVIDYKGFTAFINPKNHSVQMITNEYEYRRFAEQENVICIIDGVPPKINHDFTGPKLIMISSPKKELIKNFTKAQRTKTLYMPTWKWSEILSYYNYIYNKNADFTQQLLKEKFTLCGRNARVIFNPETSLESIKADIDIAMTLVSGKVLEYQGEPFIGDELTHRLAHIYTNDDETITDNLYTESICYFASKYIANLVFNKLNEKVTKMLIKFVESAKDIKELKGFLGQIFEMITHLIFHKGVNFTICRLDQFDQPSHNDVRNFGTLEEKVYNKVEEINEKEKYYRPSAKNAESINS